MGENGPGIRSPASGRRRGGAATPSRILSRGVRQFVVASAPLDRLLRTFLEHRRHLAAVIDEFGGFAGIVTLEDLIKELLGQEIVDESDRDTDLRALARRRRRHALLGHGG